MLLGLAGVWAGRCRWILQFFGRFPDIGRKVSEFLTSAPARAEVDGLNLLKLTNTWSWHGICMAGAGLAAKAGAVPGTLKRAGHPAVSAMPGT